MGHLLRQAANEKKLPLAISPWKFESFTRFGDTDAPTKKPVIRNMCGSFNCQCCAFETSACEAPNLWLVFEGCLDGNFELTSNSVVNWMHPIFHPNLVKISVFLKVQRVFPEGSRGWSLHFLGVHDFLEQPRYCLCVLWRNQTSGNSKHASQQGSQCCLLWMLNCSHGNSPGKSCSVVCPQLG